tara:strand:- start:47 stop:766 length:720 start_codon:yes stop_codon:yes gene_type:complete
MVDRLTDQSKQSYPWLQRPWSRIGTIEEGKRLAVPRDPWTGMTGRNYNLPPGPNPLFPASRFPPQRAALPNPNVATTTYSNFRDSSGQWREEPRTYTPRQYRQPPVYNVDSPVRTPEQIEAERKGATKRVAPSTGISPLDQRQFDKIARQGALAGAVKQSRLEKINTQLNEIKAKLNYEKNRLIKTYEHITRTQSGYSGSRYGRGGGGGFVDLRPQSGVREGLGAKGASSYGIRPKFKL